MDAATTRKMQKEIQAALGPIAKKYGLGLPEVDVRRFRKDAGVRIMKIDMMKGASASPKANTAAELKNAMKMYGITATANTNGDKLVGYVPRRPKYPFVMEGPRGGQWKLSVEQARARFN